jgi:SnoaL-like domain
MDPKQTIQAFVDAINGQDWARLDALVAPDFVRYSIAAGEPAVRSRADLVGFFAANTKRFQTPRKQSSIYLLKAKKSRCGTISAERNTVRWVRICLPGRP